MQGRPLHEFEFLSGWKKHIASPSSHCVSFELQHKRFRGEAATAASHDVIRHASSGRIKRNPSWRISDPSPTLLQFTVGAEGPWYCWFVAATLPLTPSHPLTPYNTRVFEALSICMNLRVLRNTCRRCARTSVGCFFVHGLYFGLVPNLEGVWYNKFLFASYSGVLYSRLGFNRHVHFQTFGT